MCIFVHVYYQSIVEEEILFVVEIYFFRDMSAGGAEPSCYIHTGIARDVLCVCLVVSLSGSSFRLLRERREKSFLSLLMISFYITSSMVEKKEEKVDVDIR